MTFYDKFIDYLLGKAEFPVLQFPNVPMPTGFEQEEEVDRATKEAEENPEHFWDGAPWNVQNPGDMEDEDTKDEYNRGEDEGD